MAMNSRGGHNKKSTAEHIENGTYRPCRHGEIFEEDVKVLKDIKKSVYDEFKKAAEILNDKNAKIELQRISKENLIDYAKLFHALAVKVPPKTVKQNNEDEDGFKNQFKQPS